MKIWIDGACNPNPGHAGYGIHALTDDGRVIDAGDYLGQEYAWLIKREGVSLGSLPGERP